MSLYDDASLVMIPSGYKDGKVYSIKPTNGDGDLTFTRSNDTATRVGPDGLIEKVRTNVALYSEDFTQTNWDKTGVSITANTTANPINGATTADTLTATAGNTLHFLYDDAAPFSAGENTISIYAKYINNQWICLQWYDGSASAEASFDIQNGVVGAVDAGASSSITSIGSGWYRLSLTKTSTSGGTGYYVIGLNNSDAATLQVWNATGSETAYIFGAQLETGVLTDYIATTTAAVSVGPVANLPRLDYLDSSCPKLLLEPQRTNSAQYSEQADNAWWAKFQCSITANQAVSPDGYTNADLLTMTANGSGVIYRTGSTAGALSFFAKAATLSAGAEFKISVDGVGTAFWNQDGTLSSVTGGTATNAINYGNGWYRFTLVVGSGSVINFGLSDATSGDTAYIWGMQNEASASYATSYIPTLSAASTRGGDVCIDGGNASTFNDSQGVLYADISSFEGANEDRQISISDGSNSNRVGFQLLANGTQIQFYLESGGSIQLNSIQTIDATNGIKIAISYKVNDFKVYVNGSLIVTDTSGAVPIGLNELAFDRGTGGDIFYGKVKQVLTFNTSLSNAELAALTTI